MCRTRPTPRRRSGPSGSGTDPRVLSLCRSTGPSFGRPPRPVPLSGSDPPTCRVVDGEVRPSGPMVPLSKDGSWYSERIRPGQSWVHAETTRVSLCKSLFPRPVPCRRGTSPGSPTVGVRGPGVSRTGSHTVLLPPPGKRGCVDRRNARGHSFDGLPPSDTRVSPSCYGWSSEVLFSDPLFS